MWTWPTDGETLPKWSTFFRLQVYQRIGISKFEVQKREGNRAFKSQFTCILRDYQKEKKRIDVDFLEICERGTIFL